MVRPLNAHAGAPASFCHTLSYHPSAHDVTVRPRPFLEAAAEALAVTGLRPVLCEGAPAGKACGTTGLGWSAGRA